MEILMRRIFSILGGLLLLVLVAACGMGGTEVGNPRPGVPASGPDGDAEPSFEGATPSPTPAMIEFEGEELE